MELHSNEGGFLQSIDNLAARHVSAMETCGLYVPDLWPFPRDWYHDPLHTNGRSGDRPRTFGVVY